MDTPTLTTILLEAMQGYAGKGLNAHSVFAKNDVERIYTVIDFANINGKRIISTPLVARIIDNSIVIEVDHNSKLLVDALVAIGVPEEQIILGYVEDQVKA